MMEGSVADVAEVSYRPFHYFSLSEEGVTHRNVGDYHCHLSRHPFVSQIKSILKSLQAVGVSEKSFVVNTRYWYLEVGLT